MKAQNMIINTNQSLQERVYNLQGSLLTSFSMNENAEIDVRQFNPGMYLVMFVDGLNNRVLNKKFIVSR